MTEEERPAEEGPEKVEAEPMGSGGEPTNDEKLMALLAHIGAIFTSFILPLILMIVKKDESEYVVEHSKESLNFQITLVIAHIVAGLTICFTFGFLNMILGIVGIIFPILAGIEANNGKMYKYPVTLRLVK